MEDSAIAGISCSRTSTLPSHWLGAASGKRTWHECADPKMWQAGLSSEAPWSRCFTRMIRLRSSIVVTPSWNAWLRSLNIWKVRNRKWLVKVDLHITITSSRLYVFSCSRAYFCKINQSFSPLPIQVTPMLWPIANTAEYKEAEGKSCILDTWICSKENSCFKEEVYRSKIKDVFLCLLVSQN